MTDKKTFGSFIKAKRTEKNFSQKDLAEMLLISAVFIVIGVYRHKNIVRK